MKPTRALLIVFVFTLLPSGLLRANAYEDWFHGRPSSVGTERALQLFAAKLPLEGKSLPRLAANVKKLERDEGVIRAALLKDYLQEGKEPLWPLLSECRRHTKLANKRVDGFVKNSTQRIDHLLEAVLTLDEANDTLAATASWDAQTAEPAESGYSTGKGASDQPSFAGLNSVPTLWNGSTSTETLEPQLSLNRSKLEHSRRWTLIKYGLSETKALYDYLLERSLGKEDSLLRAGHYIDKTASSLGQGNRLDGRNCRLLVQYLSAALYELSTAR